MHEDGVGGWGGERVKNITLYVNISTVTFLQTVYNWNCYKKWTPQDDCESLERSLLSSGGKAHVCTCAGIYELETIWTSLACSLLFLLVHQISRTL